MGTAIRSPALAGIDPGLPLSTSAAASFPRARGDRPNLAVTKVDMFYVPPRSRDRPGRKGRGLSFPLAEIDSQPFHLGVCTFPRARGDRPWITCIWPSDLGVPPRSRG